jgi:hypothetical protein
MKRLPTALLLCGAIAVSACSDLPTPAAHAPDNPIEEVFRQPTPASRLLSIDAAFAEIAGRIDGFGGLYYDERGIANVYMAARAGGAQLDAATLAAQLNTQLRQVGLDGSISAQQLVVRSGAYDFGELSRFHRDVIPVLGVPGVVFTDADETLNRIVIGVEAGTSEDAIQDMIRQLGVPVGAVVVVETDPILPVQSFRDHAELHFTNLGGLPTLREAVRPIAGGLQIWRLTSPTTGSICTLGFNASAPSFSQELLMFTNSHCTAVRGQVTGVEWSQKSFSLPADPVAIEIEDPPFFTNADNPACPANRVCRWADAAAGKYTVPNDQVAGFRIMMPFPGTLVLPAAHRTFRVAEEATARPVVGQGLMKVGRTSGMTGAAVIATCQNANTAPNITYLCQERVAIDAIGGDSGSPVFESIDSRAFMDVTANQRVRLHGLLWGGSANTYVYSSILNIRMDFPGPWVVMP